MSEINWKSVPVFRCMVKKCLFAIVSVWKGKTIIGMSCR